MSYATIAQQLGCTPQAAHKMVRKELEKLEQDTASDREEVRLLELERLDRMLMGCWNAATDGDKDAILSALRIMERRSKLLGTDMPAKTAFTDPTGEHEAEGAGVLVLPETAEGVDAWLRAVGHWKERKGEDDQQTTPKDDG